MQVLLEEKEALIGYRPTETNPAILVDKIEDMGFDAKVKEIQSRNSQYDTGAAVKETVIDIEGMTCMSCVRTIEGMISKLDGIQQITVSLENKSATVSYDPSKLTADKIANEIDDLGFDARVHNTFPMHEVVTIYVEGMTCQSCVKTIETNMSSKDGIKEVKVFLPEKQVFFVYDPKKTNPEVLCSNLDDMGFTASLLRRESSDDEFEDIVWRRRSELDLAKPKQSECVIDIDGMTCGSCVRNIENNISSKKGIKSIKVFLENKNGIVQYDSSLTTSKVIAEMIEDMGFEAKVVSDQRGHSNKVKLNNIVVGIQGMTCQSCVKTIEGNISDHHGVKRIKVSLADQNAQVTFYPDKVSAVAIRDAVNDMGFQATLPGMFLTQSLGEMVHIFFMSSHTCL